MDIELVNCKPSPDICSSQQKRHKPVKTAPEDSSTRPFQTSCPPAQQDHPTTLCCGWRSFHRQHTSRRLSRSRSFQTVRSTARSTRPAAKLEEAGGGGVEGEQRSLGADAPGFVLRHRGHGNADGDTAQEGPGESSNVCSEGHAHNGMTRRRPSGLELPTEGKAAAGGGTDGGTDSSSTVEELKTPDEGFMGMTPLLQAHHAMEKMEEFVHKVWEGRWRVIPHDVLPEWLKDNEFLQHGHRPPMPSFRACFRSIFRIHTETGNIWTHLLGCLFFLCLGIMYMFRSNMYFAAPFQEKIVIGIFFIGAILCLSFSWLFHTVYCHSEGVSRVFSKLDYSGIAFLIMGSFVPWLYYSFYCSPNPRLIYLIVVCILGVSAIIVSQCDFFAKPQYGRPEQSKAVNLRCFQLPAEKTPNGVFVGLGLSGVVPTLHFVISEGLLRATTMGQMGWLLLMATLYIAGAGIYAARIPERFFPGKCDIWFHSHQLFHILVVAGAFVHFHGVSNLQAFRYAAGAGCEMDNAL
ncbi:hypothetical protein UPYG_G00249200 [Umbra pygmaea]|uniref:Adiponectin receptor 2 n=1 Tax=Umbra pygmaea TaxID=75934 RepID=A0ABD0W784_UMBPY